MAKRRSSKTPLEWVAVKSNVVAGAAITREVVQLALDDDEIAEIRMIDSNIEPDMGIVDDEVFAGMLLSMDPSVTLTSPFTEVQYEDLETLYTHFHRYRIEVGTIGDLYLPIENNKQIVFPENFPLLLATNPAFIFNSDAGVDIDYFARIYFTRKRASGEELLRTLLKRR